MINRVAWRDLRWILPVLAAPLLALSLLAPDAEVLRSPAVAGWLYLLVLIPVTLRRGRTVGLLAALAMSVLHFLLFVAPATSVRPEDRSDLVRLGLSLGGMVLVVLLVDRANRARLAAERRLAEQAVREEAQRLALLGMGHDLGQPMTVLMAGLQLLARQHERLSAEERAARIAGLVRTSERMRRFVGDWMDLARGNAPAALAREPVDVCGLVEETAEQFRDVLPQGLMLEVAPGLPRVLGDRSALERVLANLLTNAAKYGDGTATVRVRLVEPESVQVSVLDRGPGIAREDLPELFTPFRRGTGADARAQGYGLGLAVAGMLVQAQGGRIWAENREDGGAAFHVLLPAEAVVAEDEVALRNGVEAASGQRALLSLSGTAGR